MWRNFIEPIIYILHIAGNEWLSTGEILWLHNAEEIDELLSNNILDNDDDYDDDEDEYEQEDDGSELESIMV